ncbi:hypothetical protein FBUS_07723 [Fasciolopsis buskii]|uniref:Uncharacterized protein n=1 Tax=Fasciolopsis buskii TaxID=27845 RepID=A0A8E0RWF2_9TREM|nr:hypothetical protein FBUS_07723 [Fasciolopsis buski]
MYSFPHILLTLIKLQKPSSLDAQLECRKQSASLKQSENVTEPSSEEHAQPSSTTSSKGSLRIVSPGLDEKYLKWKNETKDSGTKRELPRPLPQDFPEKWSTSQIEEKSSEPWIEQFLEASERSDIIINVSTEAFPSCADVNEDLQHPVKHVEDNQASADRQAEYLNNVSSPKMSEEELIPRTFKQLDAEESPVLPEVPQCPSRASTVCAMHGYTTTSIGIPVLPSSNSTFIAFGTSVQPYKEIPSLVNGSGIAAINNMETPTAIQPTSTSLGNPSETVRLEKKTGYGMVTSTAMTVWSGNWADDAVNKPMLEYLSNLCCPFFLVILQPASMYGEQIQYSASDAPHTQAPFGQPHTGPVYTVPPTTRSNTYSPTCLSPPAYIHILTQTPYVNGPFSPLEQVNDQLLFHL